jgi:hypothetical protein
MAGSFFHGRKMRASRLRRAKRAREKNSNFALTITAVAFLCRENYILLEKAPADEIGSFYYRFQPGMSRPTLQAR